VARCPVLDPYALAWFTSAWQQLDAWLSANGVYQQYIGATTPMTSISPTWMAFMANQAQMTLKKDFFSLVPFQQLANDMGVSFNNPILAGADLQAAVATVIVGLQKYGSGNYSEVPSDLLHRGRVPLLTVRFQKAMSDGELAAASAGTVVAGTGVFVGAGGIGALSGAALTGEAIGAAALAGSGLLLILLGVAGVSYVAGRVFRQRLGDSGPWAHPDQNPGDPPYLRRLQSRPWLFPPLLPPSPQPNFER